MSSASKQPGWRSWDEANLARMEKLISYDITHDGYRVRIARLSAVGQPAVEEFRWLLNTRTAGL